MHGPQKGSVDGDAIPPFGVRSGDRHPIRDSAWRVNLFQGRFPAVNTTEDGFLATAPVHTFAPSGFGLWQA